jgi:hypothetical protein
MTTPEAKVKVKVKRLLKEFEAYQFWPVQTGFGSKTLDCLVCYCGKFIAIETKALGKTPTPLQHSTMHDIGATGGIVLVIDSDAGVEQLRKLLEKVRHENCYGKPQAQGGGGSPRPSSYKSFPLSEHGGSWGRRTHWYPPSTD